MQTFATNDDLFKKDSVLLFIFTGGSDQVPPPLKSDTATWRTNRRKRAFHLKGTNDVPKDETPESQVKQI